MRTIILREHQPKIETLSPSELTALQAASKHISVGLTAEANTYELRPGSIVGTLVFDGVRVLIKPKVELTNLFFLLGFGADLTAWANREFPYETEPDLLHAIGWAFEAAVEQGLRQGLVRGYLGYEESLPTVRGRIDLGRQQRVRQSLPFPLECRFEEYTEDIQLNHLMKAAHRRLRMAPGIDPVLSKRLLFRQRSFADVSDVDFAPSRVPTHEFTRLDQHWEGAGHLAELILRQETLRDEAGAVIGAAFTVDMNRLFEKFATDIVREEATAAGFDLVPQARRWLSREIVMKPDLVLASRSTDLAVGDVKYKELDIQGWPHADLYQLLAYCAALGLPRGLLIYADYRAPKHHVVQHAGISLEVVGIDMQLPPAPLVEETRKAARILIGQARERTGAMEVVA